jgi:hypothetical protein
MIAKTIKGQTADALADELEKATSDGFRPTLALLFLSHRQNREAVVDLLDRRGIAIFGATTAGEFIDGDIGEGSIAVMLLDLQPAYFKISFLPIDENNVAQLARRLGQEGRDTFTRPAFLVSYSGFFTDGEMLVKGIEEAAGAGAVIFGGMAGDDLTFTGTYVFSNRQTGDKAILALIIDGEKIMLNGHATSGWKAVGKEHVVTRSEGSVVYTIDEEPAVQVVLRSLGINPQTPTELNEALAKMGSFLPILMQRKEGDAVVRTSMFANVEEQSLKFSGNVPQGAKFRFALPPDFEVVDEVIAQSREVKANQLPEADALIMFSCVARHVTLGPMISDEIEGLKQVWGSPLIGFFSYGEIGKTVNGKPEFHNNTCCLVAMKEKEPAAIANT